MKLASYLWHGSAGFGIIEGQRIRDLSDVMPRISDLCDLIVEADGDIGRFIKRHASGEGRYLALSEVALMAPIPRPGKYLALGGNYPSHRSESEVARVNGMRQIWFNKQTSCLAPPYADVIKPSSSDQLDYEGELGVVIGKPCRKVRADRARDFIAGYLVCNDLSVRDWQARSPTHTLGKSFDSHGPIGPWLTTIDEIGTEPDLRLRTWVNGEIRQDARTSEMIFSIGEMIEELSNFVTLEPGDILATGTPAGVGKYLSPSRYLQPGDVVRVEIEGLGSIENTIVGESDPGTSA